MGTWKSIFVSRYNNEILLDSPAGADITMMLNSKTGRYKELSVLKNCFYYCVIREKEERLL